VPDFGPDRPEGATDFNDLARHAGPKAVEHAIQNARTLFAKNARDWRDDHHQVDDDHHRDAHHDGASAPEVSERQPDAANAPEGDLDGGELLECVLDFLRRFVSYPSVECAVADTLWIAHTHSMDAWESTPRIAFLSPEPGSGKTRALEVTETLVPRPVESRPFRWSCTGLSCQLLKSRLNSLLAREAGRRPGTGRQRQLRIRLGIRIAASIYFFKGMTWPVHSRHFAYRSPRSSAA